MFEGGGHTGETTPATPQSAEDRETLERRMGTIVSNANLEYQQRRRTETDFDHDKALGEIRDKYKLDGEWADQLYDTVVSYDLGNRVNDALGEYRGTAGAGTSFNEELFNGVVGKYYLGDLGAKALRDTLEERKAPVTESMDEEGNVEGAGTGETSGRGGTERVEGIKNNLRIGLSDSGATDEERQVIEERIAALTSGKGFGRAVREIRNDIVALVEKNPERAARTRTPEATGTVEERELAEIAEVAAEARRKGVRVSDIAEAVLGGPALAPDVPPTPTPAPEPAPANTPESGAAADQAARERDAEAARNRAEAERWTGLRPGGPGGRIPNEPPQGPRNPGIVQNEAEAEANEGWKNPRNYLGLEPKSIRDILANERDALLFGEALKKLYPVEGPKIQERYQNGPPSEDDMKLMNNAAREYTLWRKWADEVNGRLTPSEIELLARPGRSQPLVNLMGHEGARGEDVLKNAVLILAMQKPELIWKVRQSFGNLDELRATSEFRKHQQGIWDLSKLAGTKVKEFDVAYDVATPEGRMETRMSLEARVRQSASNFRKALDWTKDNLGIYVPGSSLSVARRGVSRAVQLNNPKGYWTREIKAAVGENLQFIAEHLGAAVSNPEWRALIAQETLSNQNTVLASERGPRTFTQAQELVARPENSPAAVQARVAARIAANPNYASWDKTRKKEWLNNEVRSEEVRRHKQGMGWFASLVAFIFGQNIDKGIHAAAGDAVFA